MTLEQHLGGTLGGHLRGTLEGQLGALRTIGVLGGNIGGSGGYLRILGNTLGSRDTWGHFVEGEKRVSIPIPSRGDT